MATVEIVMMIAIIVVVFVMVSEAIPASSPSTAGSFC